MNTLNKILWAFTSLCITLLYRSEAKADYTGTINGFPAREFYTNNGCTPTAANEYNELEAKGEFTEQNLKARDLFTGTDYSCPNSFFMFGTRDAAGNLVCEKCPSSGVTKYGVVGDVVIGKIYDSILYTYCDSFFRMYGKLEDAGGYRERYIGTYTTEWIGATKEDCYIQAGSAASDETGDFSVSDKCYWDE